MGEAPQGAPAVHRTPTLLQRSVGSPTVFAITYASVAGGLYFLLGPIAGHWQLTLGLTIIAFVAALPRGLIGLGTRVRGLVSERAARAATAKSP